MLVLSRKTSQTIEIGENVRVTVVRISRDQVRLGIDAPKDVKIVRPDARCKYGKRKKEEDTGNE